MGRLYKAGCREKAVLWEFSGSYDDEGRSIVNSPVEIDVRWSPVDTEGDDPMGNTIGETARVAVTQSIPVNSIMWLGELVDVADLPIDLYKVVKRNYAKDIMGRETRRELLLERYSDTLPELAGT